MDAPPSSPHLPPSERWRLAFLFALWGAFTAWCVSGTPPSVDLGAHGAQMQTLADLLRGDAEVARHYTWHFPLGYGLPNWLFLPVTWATNGATAARLAAWTALMLFPLAHLALVRVVGRPTWTLVLGLPLAFNVSYWYGFLPTLLALPLALLALAAFWRALQQPGRDAWAWVTAGAAAATLCMLSHLVAFAALGVAAGALVLAFPDRRRALGLAAATLALPAALCAARVATLALRAVTPGTAPRPTEYALLAHLNALTKLYRPEGLLPVVGPALVTLVLVGAWVRRRRQEPRAPLLVLLALAALYLATPKSLSGAWMVHVRLAVLVTFAALLLVDPAHLPRPLRMLLVLLSLAQLGETARFHWRFARAVEGLGTLVATPPPPGPHGAVSLVGKQVLGSRISYLEHLGQWWTATHGGVGHHFFAREDQHPVRFVPGAELPDWLLPDDAAPLAPFRALLVYGEGPLPPALAGFTETARAGAWRRLERR